MVNETFEFSPRVGLILSNIKTVREIRRVLDDEGITEITRFLKYIGDNLKEKVPDIDSWKLVFHETGVSIFPGDQWKVLDDDSITITIEFNRMDPLDLEGDPWVGLYVPENWPQIKLFKERLIKALPWDFKNYWEKPEDSWPIWAWVKYEHHAKDDNFDSNAFLVDVAKLVSKLVKIKYIIDTTIKQVQK